MRNQYTQPTRTIFVVHKLPKRDKKTKRAPPGFPDGAQKSAMTYFPAEQYHRRRKFHFCVRDGNRCFLSPIVTDKS